MELSPEYFGPRRLTITPDKKSAAERTAMVHEQFLRMMDSIRDRSDRLLEKVVWQEQISRQRLREIEDRVSPCATAARSTLGPSAINGTGRARYWRGPRRKKPSASTA